MLSRASRSELGWLAGRRAFEFGTMLSFVIPGTVVGVGCVLDFNVPPIEITGTGFILVACFVFRNTVCSFVRAMTAVSAVTVLVSARYDIATTYIVGRAEAGEFGLAIAYSCALIVVMLAVVVLIRLAVGERRLGRRVAGARRLRPHRRDAGRAEGLGSEPDQAVALVG